MAITRCPYCHAIIDESDKYCNNCGTQLLFPEDDEVEEEIPGEKIVDAEVEEKDYTVDEPEDEKRRATSADAGGEDEPEAGKEAGADPDEELPEETEEMALSDLLDEEETDEEDDGEVTEEVVLVDEIEAAEAEAGAGSGETPPEPLKDDTAAPMTAGGDETAEREREGPDRKDEDREDAAGPEEDEGDEEGTVEIPGPLGASDAEAEVEYVTETSEDDLASTAGESALRPVTFDTRELEGIGKTVEIGRESIDRFIEDRAPKPPEPPLPQTAADRPSTGSLPPWASTMKGAPDFPEDTGPVETRRVAGGGPSPTPSPTPSTEEVEIFPRRRASDSTIGLPERVAQAPLPFEREATGEVEETEEEAEAEEEEAGGELTMEPPEEAASAAAPVRAPVLPVRGPEPRGPAPREPEAGAPVDEAEPGPPFSFAVFFKSKAFDALFVGLFWLVALWLAAHSMGQTLFDILGGMSGSMLLLYASLLALYVFLFKFFLGETLGDRLFRPRD